MKLTSTFRRPLGHHTEEHHNANQAQDKKPSGIEEPEPAGWNETPDEVSPRRPAWSYGPLEEENVWGK